MKCQSRRVNVGGKVRTVVAVATWEGDQLCCGGSKAASSSDCDLSTFWVELLVQARRQEESWTTEDCMETYSWHRVEGNGLETDEVVA